MAFFKMALMGAFAFLSIDAYALTVQQQIEKISNQQSSTYQQVDSYTVLVYGDPNVFNEFRLGAEIKRLEESFGRPVLAFKASSPSKFIESLKSLTLSKVPIQTLVFRGIHGTNFDSLPFFEISDQEDFDYALYGFEDLQDEGISLNFTNTAFIFFDSCSMINDKSVETTMIPFNEFQRIGFKSGWIYLNQTEGSYGFDNTFKVPFWESYGDSKKKLTHFAMQVIGWPVVGTMYLYLDRFKYNQGYLMGYSYEDRVLLKTHASKVIDGDIEGSLVFSTL